MKSRTKPAPRVVPTTQVQISLPMQGVFHDVKHAFYGLCIHAGREVLAQMLEADRVALCGTKACPMRRGALCVAAARAAALCSAASALRSSVRARVPSKPASWSCPHTPGPPELTR